MTPHPSPATLWRLACEDAMTISRWRRRRRSRMARLLWVALAVVSLMVGVLRWLGAA